MFSLPGSLPRSKIKKLRSKCLEQVRANMNVLDAKERAYLEKLDKQQRQSPQSQPNYNCNGNNRSVANENNMSDGEERSIDGGEEAKKQLDPQEIEKESSPSLKQEAFSNDVIN